MISFNRSLIVSIAATTAMLGLSITSVSAQTPVRLNVKSVASGECLDVYRGIAKANTPVGVYRCNPADSAQQFTFETGTFYYKDQLCVGEVNDKAVLQYCNVLTHTNIVYVNKSTSEFKESIVNGLYLTTPSMATTGFKQVTLQPTSTDVYSQVFEIVRI
jgi:hypothetical protein